MENIKVPVRSRTEGMLSYRLESLRVYRFWPVSGKVLYIPLDELKELMVTPGGEYILKNSVVIEDEKARMEILGYEPEPEYNYGEEEIKRLLYEEADEALLDCLDYAPIGVLNLLRQFAIEKMPNTTAKTQAINKKFNIDLHALSSLSKEVVDEDREHEATNTARRTAPITKTENPKYKVVG